MMLFMSAMLVVLLSLLSPATPAPVQMQQQGTPADNNAHHRVNPVAGANHASSDHLRGLSNVPRGVLIRRPLPSYAIGGVPHPHRDDLTDPGRLSFVPKGQILPKHESPYDRKDAVIRRLVRVPVERSPLVDSKPQLAGDGPHSSGAMPHPVGDGRPRLVRLALHPTQEDRSDEDNSNYDRDILDSDEKSSSEERTEGADDRLDLGNIALGNGLEALSGGSGEGGIALYPFDMLKIIWKQISNDPYRLGLSLAELKQVMHLFKTLLSVLSIFWAMFNFVRNQNNSHQLNQLGLMTSGSFKGGLKTSGGAGSWALGGNRRGWSRGGGGWSRGRGGWSRGGGGWSRGGGGRQTNTNLTPDVLAVRRAIMNGDLSLVDNLVRDPDSLKDLLTRLKGGNLKAVVNYLMKDPSLSAYPGVITAIRPYIPKTRGK